MLGETQYQHMESMLADFKSYMSTLRDALPILIDIFGKPAADLIPSSLVVDKLVAYMETSKNSKVFANVVRLWPAGAVSCGCLFAQVQAIAKDILGNHAATFKDFLVNVGKNNIESSHLLKKDLVGNTEDVHLLDFCIQGGFSKILSLYFSALKGNQRNIKIAGLEGEIACDLVCFGSSMLPLIKRMVQLEDVLEAVGKMKTLESNIPVAIGSKAAELMTNTQLEALTSKVLAGMKSVFQILDAVQKCADMLEGDVAALSQSLTKKCKEALAKILASALNGVNKELDLVIQFVSKTVGGLLDEFKLSEVFESDAIEPSNIQAACTDPRAQQLYTICSQQGKKSLAETQDAVKNLIPLCSPGECFQFVVQLATAITSDFSKFLEAEIKTKQGIPFAAYVVGSLTLAQSLARPLQTGETRPGLVQKALTAILRREWKCHAGLLSKCQSTVGSRS